MNTTADFDAFVQQAWADHADDAAGVARRIEAQGLQHLSHADQVARLAMLAHHVWGEHLGDWPSGQSWLAQLDAQACVDEAGRAAIRRCQASLALCADETAAPFDLSPSDRIRVRAMAAANLATADTQRARSLFDRALQDCEEAALPDSDAAVRALAVSANNLAGTLEEKTPRSSRERELMIAAAQAARHCWERAGGWTEVERAEYRLALTWLEAGETALALKHGQLCLQICLDNDAPAFERFFAWEALTRVQRAAGDASAHAQALIEADGAFAALDEADQQACQLSLDQLHAPPAGN